MAEETPSPEKGPASGGKPRDSVRQRRLGAGGSSRTEGAGKSASAGDASKWQSTRGLDDSDWTRLAGDVQESSSKRAGEDTVVLAASPDLVPLPYSERKAGRRPPEKSAPPAVEVEAATEVEVEEAKAPVVPARYPLARVIRLVILSLLIVAVMGATLHKLLTEPSSRGGSGAGALPGKVVYDDLSPTPQAVEEAKKLERELRDGDFAGVAGKRGAVMSDYPVNASALRLVNLADSALTVFDLAKKLDVPPGIDSPDGDVSIEDELEKAAPRVDLLALLGEYRDDWGGELLELPGMREIYSELSGEIANIGGQVGRLEKTRDALRQVLSELSSVSPNYSQVRRNLSVAFLQSRKTPISRMFLDAGHLAAAEAAIANNNLEVASASVTAMSFSRSFPAEKLEGSIQNLLAQRGDAIARRLAEWHSIWSSGQEAEGLYRKGDIPGAVNRLSEILRYGDAVSPTLRGLYMRLERRLRHYRQVLERWQEAEARDREGSFAARIQAWSDFARIIDAGRDPAQHREAEERIEGLRGEVGGFLNRRGAEMTALLRDYRSPDSDDRDPSSPAEPFAGMAGILSRAAGLAEEIVAVGELAPGWLDDTTAEYVETARAVGNEQREQAQKLWGLGRLYRSLGDPAGFTVCMERIVMLGDGSGNPFYHDATALIAGDE